MNASKALKGHIHSLESFGTLDGPGIRFVVFFAGCPLRCRYCHNIDVAQGENGSWQTAEELVQHILPNKPYLTPNGGGITVSGGDPFFQPEFLQKFLKTCKKNGLHTAVDTSLYTTPEIIDSVLPYTDLFMVSLKHFNSQIHQDLTCVPNEQILANLRYLSAKKHRLWLRFLVVPGLTDTEQNLQDLIDFCHSINFELLELLKYHTMGVYKWGDDYTLNDVQPPSQKHMEQIKKRLEQAKIPVVLNS